MVEIKSLLSINLDIFGCPERKRQSTQFSKGESEFGILLYKLILELGIFLRNRSPGAVVNYVFYSTCTELGKDLRPVTIAGLNKRVLYFPSCFF
jgi:hypothetical protein